jgi:hypothetical protein
VNWSGIGRDIGYLTQLAVAVAVAQVAFLENIGFSRQNTPDFALFFVWFLLKDAICAQKCSKNHQFRPIFL